MESEGPPALGDVDDSVDEFGNLADQRRELVDDDDQGGRDFSRVARSFAPLLLSSFSRRVSSARSDARARRTRKGDRSVTRPTKCGSSTHWPNAEPPL